MAVFFLTCRTKIKLSSLSHRRLPAGVLPNLWRPVSEANESAAVVAALSAIDAALRAYPTDTYADELLLAEIFEIIDKGAGAPPPTARGTVRRRQNRSQGAPTTAPTLRDLGRPGEPRFERLRMAVMIRLGEKRALEAAKERLSRRGDISL